MLRIFQQEKQSFFGDEMVCIAKKLGQNSFFCGKPVVILI